MQPERNEIIIACGHFSKEHRVSCSASNKNNETIYVWSWNTGYTRYLPFVYKFINEQKYKVIVAYYSDVEEVVQSLKYYD